MYILIHHVQDRLVNWAASLYV